MFFPNHRFNLGHHRHPGVVFFVGEALTPLRQNLGGRAALQRSLGYQNVLREAVATADLVAGGSAQHGEIDALRL